MHSINAYVQNTRLITQMTYLRKIFDLHKKDFDAKDNRDLIHAIDSHWLTKQSF